MAKVDLQQSREQIKEFPVARNRDFDILFVIDNSSSMREEQESLAQNFDRFVNVLNSIESGLPSIHLGVVSTDLGAGGYGIVGCDGEGDGGRLIRGGFGGCLSPGSEPFLVDLANSDNSRNKNYSGTLAENFACMAKLGTEGCGFEQPLEAMRRALDGSNPQNHGFLRPHAFLFVVIITDEDDCSTADVSMFDTDPAQDVEDSELGFLSSFRCFEFGVACDPDNPRSPGPRQGCVPRDASPYMHKVSDYALFLKSLKEDPGQVAVSAIVGSPTPVAVGQVDGRPFVEPSCSSDAGEAAPAIRIRSFLDAFPNRNTSTNICDGDLSDALSITAEFLARTLGAPCMDGDLLMEDGEPICTVSDIYRYHQDGQEETLLAQCNAAMDNLPCYHFESDSEICTQGSQISLQVERGAASIRSNTTVVARCIAES